MADRIANTFDEAAEPAWDFAASPYRPDLVVINLGSNDFSTLPHPSRDEFAAAYTRILQTLRGAYGDEMPILCVAPRVSEPAFTYIRDCVSPASCRTSISRPSCPATATTGASSDRRPIPITRDIARWRCC